MKRVTQTLFTLLCSIKLLQCFLLWLPNMLFQLWDKTQSSVKQFLYFRFILCWPKEQAFWHVELSALPEFSLTMKNLGRKRKWRMQSKVPALKQSAFCHHFSARPCFTLFPQLPKVPRCWCKPKFSLKLKVCFLGVLSCICVEELHTQL